MQRSLALGLTSVPFLALWAWSSPFHSLNFLLSIIKWFAISRVNVLFYYFICKAEISVLLNTTLNNLRHLELCCVAGGRLRMGLPEPGLLDLPSASPVPPGSQSSPDTQVGSSWPWLESLGPYRNSGYFLVPALETLGISSSLWALWISSYQSKASFQKAGDGLHEIHHPFLLLGCFLSACCILDLLLNMEVSRKHWDSGSVLRSYHTMRGSGQKWT